VGCHGLEEVPAWVTTFTGLRVPFVVCRLRVRNTEGIEEQVQGRVRPDVVDLTTQTGLVTLPEELLASAGRELRVRSESLEALEAWLGE